MKLRPKYHERRLMISTKYAVMIPSKGRADRIAKGFRKMPFLNASNVYVGIEHREMFEYKSFCEEHSLVHYVFYHNPEGSVSFARQQLKCEAEMNPNYQRYVFTDDNAIFTYDSLIMLLRAHKAYRKPCVMAGAHATSPHFDRNRRKLMEVVGGYKSYPQPGMMFYCVARSLCDDYVFPHDTFGLDDRHFYLWLMDQGVRDFRICPDAPFTKSRYQEGGQGSIKERMMKCGRAIEKIARDYPRWAGSTGTLRLPWQSIFDTLSGKTLDRLAGGAMRSETKLSQTENTDG